MTIRKGSIRGKDNREEFLQTGSSEQTRMKNYIKYILILSAAAFLSGCLSDKFESPGQTGDFVEMRFEYSFEDEDDGAAVVATRAMTADQEDYVDNMEVLVFEYNRSTGADKLLYATHGYDIKNTGGSNVKSFKAMMATEVNGVSLMGKEVFIMVFANIRSIWSSQNISYGSSCLSIRNSLIYDAAGVWDVSGTPPRYFPMSSALQTLAVIKEGMKGADFGNVILKRAVAAIDVGFNYGSGSTPLGFDNFKLGQVVVCRTPDRGYVTEIRGYSTSAPGNVPTSTLQFIDRTHKLVTTSKKGMFNEIYVPATPPAQISTGEYPFLLIGGYYGGAAEVEANLAWYRVELPVTTNNQTITLGYNCKYLFKIEAVNGPGYATQAEAIAGAPNMWANMTVVPWSQSRLNADIDGPYMFDVSQTEFVLDSDARPDDSRGDNVIDLYTDYVYGWKVDRVHYATDPGSSPWIDPSVLNGNPFVDGRMVIKLKANTGANRTGYIELSAGRWKYTVTITQESQLTVTPSSRTISPWSQRNGAMSHNTFAVEANGGAWEMAVTYPAGTANWGLEAYKTSDGKGFYLQCDRNTTADVRRAVVTVTWAGRMVNVPIIQDWVDCGIGGVTKFKQFGNTTVETHLIGGNAREYVLKGMEGELEEPFAEWDDVLKISLLSAFSWYPDGDNYACWMVENSSYGTWNTKMYNGTTPGGPYYTYANAKTACPPGWRLPNYEDLFGLAQLYSVARLGESTYMEDEMRAAEAFVRKGDAYQGGYDIHNIGSGWWRYGEYGYFMSSWDGMVSKEHMIKYLKRYPEYFQESDYPTEDKQILDYNEGAVPAAVFGETQQNGDRPTGFDVYISFSLSTTAMTTVRCVVDKVYHYE